MNRSPVSLRTSVDGRHIGLTVRFVTGPTIDDVQTIFVWREGRPDDANLVKEMRVELAEALRCMVMNDQLPPYVNNFDAEGY